MGGFSHWGQIADAAQNVRILHHDTGGVVVDPRHQAFQIRLGGDRGLRIGNGITGEVRHGFDHVRIMGVQCARQHGAATLGHAGRHRDRFPARGGAVIQRSVGHRAAIKARNLRLELEQDLQRALRDFRLIGRIGRQKLTALDDGIDAGGYMVPVSACTQEEGHIACHQVLRRQLLHMAFDRHFACVHGQAVDGAVEAGHFGHIDEQIVDARSADFCQHILPVGVGERKVAHGRGLFRGWG